MKAIAAPSYGPIERMSAIEAPVPTPGAGEVRVGVRAAGLNFRDVLVVLGVAYPGQASIGGEGAGVVLEVGPGVLGFEPGDRVMGLFGGAFGPVAVADARLLARIPFAPTGTIYGKPLMLAQSETERLLAEHLRTQGIPIDRPVELTELTEQGDHVQATRKIQGGPTRTNRSCPYNCHPRYRLFQ